MWRDNEKALKKTWISQVSTKFYLNNIKLLSIGDNKSSRSTDVSWRRKKKKRSNKTSTNEKKKTVNVSENHSEKLIFRQKEGFEISRGQHGELIVNCQLIWSDPENNQVSKTKSWSATELYSQKVIVKPL